MLTQEEVLSRIKIEEIKDKRFKVTDQDGEEVLFVQHFPETFLVVTKDQVCEIPTSFLKQLSDTFE